MDRILEYAFRLAETRRGHVTSATKSNGIFHSMPCWDERFAAAAARHPGVRTAQYHVDILAAHFVQHPVDALGGLDLVDGDDVRVVEGEAARASWTKRSRRVSRAR